uniref:Ferredoxin n=1 Tax=Dictyopteris divaricata TaxID=156996 RepID=A0A2I4Q2K8_9PHAE|nr:ferredoxin [Dictyopteris divaricata]YP_010205366.1 ferredoxin [Grateloupia livida]AQZ25077.1 ferredoxin [Dictyopteris divaricata]UAV85935.1 ferredoxin [Grateloupia livida]
MPAFKIHVKSKEHKIDKVIECGDDKYILDATEEAELNLPYSCRAGACSSCAGKLEKGKVDQTEQSFLDDEQLNAGYILTCVAYPLSNCSLICHAEGDLFD